ncbi:MAG: hypothetical protein QXX08_02695 [Candidatus Bathyarchaeia archaeon]
MVKRLVVKTNNPQTLLDTIHELGTSFYCKTGQNTYRVVYFASNREIHFEGALNEEQLDKLKADSQEVQNITINEVTSEIIVEEA